jgi:hypothetical protein
MNNWIGYPSSRVTTVDLSSPDRLVVTDRASIPGRIRASRMITDEGTSTLYVVTGGYEEWLNEDGESVWESRPVVSSFDLTDGYLEKRSQLNLGGYIADVQASPEVLLVARNDWNDGDRTGGVSVVDISEPDGTMTEGDQVETAGYIRNQFNLDLYNGILRVVSEGRWGSDRANFVQTFGASDIHDLTPICELSFGDNQDLFATRFLGNRLFAHTADEDDPFHAFALGADGSCREISEFEISGWNDFLRPVMSDSRLIGIGATKDEDGTTAAVSLYDVSDAAEDTPRAIGRHPLIAQEEVAIPYSWSDGSWDHRAFSVLENAVEVEGPGGVVETGLVLLPYTGWNEETEEYASAVQIFTFSEDSLTPRGTMNHGTPVRRSFRVDVEVVANLSDARLRLFDTSDPDDPIELGSTRLPRPMPQGPEISSLCSGDECAPVDPNQNRVSLTLGGTSLITLESDLFSEFTDVTVSYGNRRYDITDLCSIRQRQSGGKNQIEVLFNSFDLPIGPHTWARYRVTLHPMPPIPPSTKTWDGIWIRRAR